MSAWHRDVLVCSFVTCLATSASADTIRVPADYPTIQEGIDAASPWDSVLVSDGVYTGLGNVYLSLAGKTITVRSENGPDRCVIDCGGQYRGFDFYNGETSAAVIDGFTITRARNVAGIWCTHGSSPTIRNCVMLRNLSPGIECYSSSPIIQNCQIRDNSDTYYGGIYCLHSDAIIQGCIVSGNSNAGIMLSTGAASIRDCTITGNRGPGISSRGLGTVPIITNCVITGNISGRSGGGISCAEHSKPTVVNCTFRNNVAEEAGAFFAGPTTEPAIINCILWGNLPIEINEDHWNPIVVTYSDVRGGWPGTGNINADPLFAFPNDAHLTTQSECIDAGTNNPPAGLVPTDADGTVRPLDGDDDGTSVADMGAYEFGLAKPCIALSQSAFEFFPEQDGSSADDRQLLIRNCGGAPLNWKALAGCAWLEVHPPEGYSLGEIDEVKLHVSTFGLPNGTHLCTLSIEDPQAVNSPQAVQVTLHVGGVIPTASVWGLLVLSLLVLTVGKVVFSSRREVV